MRDYALPNDPGDKRYADKPIWSWRQLRSRIVARPSRYDSRFYEARVSGVPEVTLWGTGTPRRELLHVDDLANAACFLMENYDAPELINVGVGGELTIAELAVLVAQVIGYTGRIVFDPSRPDGTPRRLLDLSRIQNLGWHAQIPLERGVASTYQWYLSSASQVVAAGESRE